MTAEEIRALTQESNNRIAEEEKAKEEKERKRREETHRWYVEQFIPKRLEEVRGEIKAIALQGKRFHSINECEDGCKLLKELLDKDGFATVLRSKYVPEYKASGDEYAYSHDAFTQYSLDIAW